MHSFGKRSRRLALTLALGSVALSFTALIPSHSQSISKAETPRQVADLLDCIAQERFRKDDGQFGMSRMVTINGHETVAEFRFRTKTPQEKQLLARADAANRNYSLSFLHTSHVPGNKRIIITGSKTVTSSAPLEFKPYLTRLITRRATPSGDKMTQAEITQLREEEQKEQKDFEKVALAALPQLQKGKFREADAGNWRVVMRPVQASKDSCLKCHAGAKKDATLGVMIYAVHKTVNPAEAKYLTQMSY